MLLAELEIYHSRPAQPTRRVALGHLILPADPPPGFGGLLLGAVLANYIADVPPELVADVHRLLEQVGRGQRVVQPRLMFRYQVDRHGLGLSVHRLEGEGERVNFSFQATGSALAQVLGAIYALERMESAARAQITPVLRRSLRWQGPIGPSFIANLTGEAPVSRIAAMANPRAWALDVLDFPMGTSTVTKKDVMHRYRTKLREVHPDLGASNLNAADLIDKLAEARRILLASAG